MNPQLKLILALFLASVPVGCGPGQVPPPTGALASEDQVVQEDVRKIMTAVYQADVATVLGYTHPKIIELMGGASRAEATLKTVLSQFQALNMKVDSLTFPAAPDFLETAKNRFVIVRTKIVVSANGQRAESLNYQFGIQEKGTSTWKYIEGSRINNENVRSLFPDFPPHYQFPEIYRKKR